MKLAFSQVSSEFRDAVAIYTDTHLRKFDRLLKHYLSESCQWHASLEVLPRTSEFSFSLDLKIPSGVFHATGVGADIRASVNAAFKEIESQYKKHQQKVRKDYIWKRKRVRMLKPGELPTGD